MSKVLSYGSLKRGLALDISLRKRYMKSATVLTDRTPYSYDGAVSGAIVGELGTRFDGIDDNINCGDVTQLNSASAFTIKFWMNQDVLNAYDRIFNKFRGATADLMIYTYTDGFFYFDIGNGYDSWGRFDYSAVISASSWHHVAWVYDGPGSANADKLKCYVDGSGQTLSFSGNPIPATTADLSGIDAYIGNPSNAFDGILDEFRIYNRALLPDEVALSYRIDKWEHP